MSTPSPTPLSPGAQRARASWDAQKARLFVYGMPRRGVPLLDRDSGLYFSPVSCFGAPESHSFVTQHNEQIHALLKEFGLPAWAPGSRCPTRHRLLALMSDATPVRTQAELAALNLESWGYGVRSTELLPVVAYRRVEDEGLLLLGGDVNERIGSIDVLDLRENQWMTCEAFDRDKFGPLPWDKLPLEAKRAVRARHAAVVKAAHDAEEKDRRARSKARQQLVRANRVRSAQLLQELKERDFACPHCQVRARDFRYLRKSEVFECSSCHRASAAMAFFIGRD
jgi:hypothetical protein